MSKSLLEQLAETAREVKAAEKDAKESVSVSREIATAMRKLVKLESETKDAKKELSKEAD